MSQAGKIALAVAKQLHMERDVAREEQQRVARERDERKRQLEEYVNQAVESLHQINQPYRFGMVGRELLYNGQPIAKILVVWNARHSEYEIDVTDVKGESKSYTTQKEFDLRIGEIAGRVI
jgi:hypothetical protein